MNEAPHIQPIKLESVEDRRSITEEEVLSFLKSQGIMPLEDSTMQPLLYVLPEELRGDRGPYRNLPKRIRPCIARIESPALITNFIPPQKRKPKLETTIKNSLGGRVDYYAIDPHTKSVTYMFIPKGLDPFSTRKTYFVRLDNLFPANDTLFPPSTTRYNPLS